MADVSMSDLEVTGAAPEPLQLPTDPDALVDIDTLARWLSVSTHTITLWCRNGRWPRPLNIGGGRRGKRLWRAETVRRALLRLEMAGGGASHA